MNSLRKGWHWLVTLVCAVGALAAGRLAVATWAIAGDDRGDAGWMWYAVTGFLALAAAGLLVEAIRRFILARRM